MSSSFPRLREVLRDLLTLHPAFAAQGQQHFEKIFCDALQRQGSDLHSVTAHFEFDDVVFSIRLHPKLVFSLYDGLRCGLRCFSVNMDYACNPDEGFVYYRLRQVRKTCRLNFATSNALAFRQELLF